MDKFNEDLSGGLLSAETVSHWHTSHHDRNIYRKKAQRLYNKVMQRSGNVK